MVLLEEMDAEDEDEEMNEALMRDELGSEEGEGFPGASGSESEFTPCSTNPAEKESEKESADNHEAEKGEEKQEEEEEEEEEMGVPAKRTRLLHMGKGCSSASLQRALSLSDRKSVV